MATERLERRARVLSGLPRRERGDLPLVRRVLDSPWTWALLTLATVSFLFLWDTYNTLHPDRPVPGGFLPGITDEAFGLAFRYALPTVAVWVLLFIWLDRFRPGGPVRWLLAFGWGACISTWVSMNLNTLMADLMSVRGGGNDPATAAAPAVYSAPFVEEFSKATILFILAVFVRYRIVSILQMVALAGLSAAGFAFTENILYYSRAYNYASLTTGLDPLEVLKQVAMLRGLKTAFGHELFTSFTAIGLAVALRNRSKLVRVLAPLTGIGVAALCHMLFNGYASIASSDRSLLTMMIGGWLATISMAGFLVSRFVAESQLVHSRLVDYVRMGWLRPRDPLVFGNPFRRLKLTVVALTQPHRFMATMRLMRAMTELAYLRDSMSRGLVESVGNERAADLLQIIRANRPLAVSDTVGEPVRLPRLGRRTAVAAPQVGAVGPVGPSFGTPPHR